MIEKYTESVEETQALAENIGKKIKGPVCIAFFGGLGMGKTAFTAGLAKGLGINGDIYSPTFAIVNEYRGENTALYHFDMYRIDSWEDLYTTGFFEYYDMGAVLAVEWSENIENALPENTIKIHIFPGKNENERIIRIEGSGDYEDFIC